MNKRGAGPAYLRITNSKAQFNFVWLFAILVGGAILFLAIYGALKAGETVGTQQDSETARQLATITDPLQAGFSDGSFGTLTFRSETRINNYCFTDDGFGRTEISTSTKRNIGEEWGQPGIAARLPSKYVFSSTRVSGTTYYVFSRPFNLPYEVADILMITPEHYCFIGAPDDIKDDIIAMQIPNIEVDLCNKENAVRICFGDTNIGNCDKVVDPSCTGNFCQGNEYLTGYVRDANPANDVEYTGNLLYAAIFSEKEIYECNVKRLLHRTAQLSDLFTEKGNLMDARNCGTNMQPWLRIWKTDITSGKSLTELQEAAYKLEQENRKEVCGIWN